MRSDIACFGCGHATLRLPQSVRFGGAIVAEPPALPLAVLRDCFVAVRAMLPPTGAMASSIQAYRADGKTVRRFRSVSAERCLRRPHRLQRHRGTAYHLAADTGQPAGAIRGCRRAQFDHLGILVQRYGAGGAPAGPHRPQNANDAGNGLARVVASDPFEGPVDTGPLLLPSPHPVEAGGLHLDCLRHARPTVMHSWP